MKTDINEEILKRLDAMVFLLLEIKDRENKITLKDKIRLLNDAGMDYNQIAKVLGKTPGHVAVQITMIKKNEKMKVTNNIKEDASAVALDLQEDAGDIKNG